MECNKIQGATFSSQRCLKNMRRKGKGPVVAQAVVTKEILRTKLPELPTLITTRPLIEKPRDIIEEKEHNSGKIGRFGGSFVPEILIASLSQLEAEFNKALHDEVFKAELATALRHYVGRDTPLYYAERLKEHYKSNNNGEGPEIYLKREDLNHGGSHQMNNAIGQAMLAKRMDLKRVVTATGAGQTGLATAAACAKLALECTVYMGTKHMEKQSSIVRLMKLLGAQAFKFNERIFPLKAKENSTRKSTETQNWSLFLPSTCRLEYPGVGPELSFLKDSGRAEFHSATDEQALAAYERLCKLEGIIPSLEAAHALAVIDKLVPTLGSGSKVVVNCNGRGDKDAAIVFNHKGYEAKNLL
ncbi:hypothetical protein L6164_032187 [Bauhinia variegata]|uniref:Uncharacterized protein n=1 Tax=Bauhinia variegata TaxID=167791 RepID=A0ACB9KN53_BAUVA|nr:hypothetical protein L6164_032187 [Bauhinia variegata]